MRRIAKSRRASYPSLDQLSERRLWLYAFDRCWICRQPAYDLQVHEIASRAQAPLKWATVENYFAACSHCNIHVLNTLPEAVQLAYKKHFDPQNYNRVLINRLRNEADNSISETDVNVWTDYVKAIAR